MDIRLIIFDFDGTLGDTRRNIVLTLQMTMQALHLPVATEAACAATIGLPLRTAFLHLIGGLDDHAADRCVETYGRIFDANRRQLVPGLFPGVADTIRMLAAQGRTMTIASSRSNRSLREFTAQMGLEEHIRYILGADDVMRHKPDPEPVLKTLRELHYRPENTLVVGDMPFDVEMGRRAGAHTCAVTYGNATRRELEESGAEWIIDRFPELLSIVS